MCQDTTPPTAPSYSLFPPPADAKLPFLQSNLQFIISPFFPCHFHLSLTLTVSLPPSIHPSIFQPLSCVPAPYLPSFVVPKPTHPPSSSSSLPLFSSSPDVLLLSSRLPRSFLSLMPPALSVSQSSVDFLTSEAQHSVTPVSPPSFRLFSLSWGHRIISGSEFLSL